MRRKGINRVIYASGILACILILLYFFLPVCALITRSSPSEIINSLEDPVVAHAIFLSLSTAGIATGVVVLLGTPLAYLQARTEYPGKNLVDLIIDLPIVLPPAVAGIALLILFGRKGVIGSVFADNGIQILFTTTAIVLAQIFVAGPLYIRQAKCALEMVPEMYEHAARTLGADRVSAILTVTLPLAKSGITTGIVLTFARAVGEFGATIMIAGNLPGKTQTMPVAIYSLMQSDISSAISIAVILILLSGSILAFIRIISRSEKRC